MIPIRNIMIKDFSRFSSSESAGAAIKIMEKMNVDYLLVEEEGEMKGIVTPHELVGYPLSRLLIDCVIQPACVTTEEAPADEALKVLEGGGKSFLVVLNAQGIPIGIVNRETIIDALFKELEKLDREKDKYIAKLKQVEEALEISKASFHNIVQKSTDGIIVVDREGFVRFVNPATEAIFKRKAGDLVNELFGFPVAAETAVELDLVSSGGKIGTGEMRVVETEWEGELAYLATVHDITERKQAEEKLRELDRMKSELVSNVSHELRSPLHSIRGFTKLILQGKVPDPEVQGEFLTIIDMQAEHLGVLIDDLLDMSRLESGRFSIKKRLLSIKDIVRDSVKSARSLAGRKSLEITEDMPAVLPEIEGDWERLKQVMFNLLSNAIKFSEKGGSITVKAEDRGSELMVQVIDHGIGIPGEAMPHLFERFYRAKDTMARGGTGLGLYISKQIVEAHGGRIWVESKLGEGTTFYFTISKSPQKREKIGEMLVSDGLITQQQLEGKLKKQQEVK
jgi:signal transduction histidine kinase